MIRFKVGKKYSREDIGYVCYPIEGRPKGGDWDTGYVRFEDNLIIFMNIGIPGKTGHDFPNDFNPKTDEITWFGKPNTHLNQPTFKKLISGGLKPYFFARWSHNDKFTFLGNGKILNIEDCITGEGKSVKILLKRKISIIDYLIWRINIVINFIMNFKNIDPNKKATYKQTWAIAYKFARLVQDDFKDFSERKLAVLIHGTIYYYHLHRKEEFTHGMATKLLEEYSFPKKYRKALDNYLNIMPSLKEPKQKEAENEKDGLEILSNLIKEQARTN